MIRSEGHFLMGYFHKSNIHPYQECVKREETLRSYADTIDLKVIYQEEYDLVGFIQNVVYREANRCQYCYHDRLKTTALLAKRGKFDAFSTTLLYSKFQKHELIVSIAESIAQTTGIPFFYRDFRLGWKEGIKTSKALNLYRQQYCGCIYSEKERYYSRSIEK
jgi:predicted adenine nucleotide alpha hydrolase (AANH) superfamily ATPase